MKSLHSKRLASMLGLGGLAVAITLTIGLRTAEAQGSAPDLAPMPETKPGNAAMIELGKYLFFDSRLSGDWGVSCATCHDPKKGWGDGRALSAGYTSTEYFRNAPTILNAEYRKRFLWDGRLDGKDAGTLVRDMVTESHFMNADGRLVQERLKQIPEYVAMWEKAMGKGKDPYGPRMFNIIGEFVKSIKSSNVPFDRFLKGEQDAISAEAKRGYAVFKGKAGCIACHSGSMASDGEFHRLGVPENPDILKSPLRSITMLRHYATSGMPNYMNARTDVGFYAISKKPEDVGKFLTPSLRELKYTAPYMHNGLFAGLDEVIEFYDRGGGNGSELRPLKLTTAEKADLKTFLLTLSGDPVIVKAPVLPDLQPRTFGTN